MKIRFATTEGSGAQSKRSSRVRLAFRSGLSAFTLLEVLIACTIFFMVAFAILELVTNSLAAARSLQQREPDPGVLAAMATLSDRLVEDGASGDFEDLFPGLYPGYSWTSSTNEIGSNGLFRVDFAVYSNSQKKGPTESRMSILMYRPGSPPGSATKGR